MTILFYCSDWVVLQPPKVEEQVNEFISCLQKVGPSLGMVVGKPKVFVLPDNRPTTYVKDLNAVMEMKPK